MKVKKKPKGKKARVQAYKKRSAYVATAITVAILVAIIAISSFLIYSHLNPSPNQTSNPAFQLKAAIVDHLSLSAPNQTFIKTATNILKEAGFTVDYYPGEEVNVEFYRNLPSHSHDLIILRVHSALSGERKPPLALFSSEPYNKMEHVHEQITGQVVMVRFQTYQEGDPTYFGIFPNFVRSSMNGRFENTMVIMMGCDGLTDTDMAKAFIEKGAKVYISWFGPVSASHTDLATAHVLQHFLIEKRTLKEAIRETFKEIGSDPAYKSLLIYYPLEVGDQTVEDITGNPKTKP